MEVAVLKKIFLWVPETPIGMIHAKKEEGGQNGRNDSLAAHRLYAGVLGGLADFADP